MCEKHGVLLIFDEVITGFRLSLGGAQQYFGVTPDLAIFGKAIAGGFSLSMICGRRELMEKVHLQCHTDRSSCFTGNHRRIRKARNI